VGAGSVAQGTHEYAEMVDKGKTKDKTLFFFHRQADPREDEDLEDEDQIRAAVREASGPALAKWPDFEGQIDNIVSLYNQPDTDKAYWERVWLNRRVSSTRQAFNTVRWGELAFASHSIPKGDPVTVGFDGSKWQDSTGLVVTDIDGFQHKFAAWEHDGTDDWTVPLGEVDEAVAEVMRRWSVVRLYGDPAQGWDDSLAAWAGKYGPKKVLFYYTDSRNTRKIATACRAYAAAIRGGALSHDGDEVFGRHIANSRKRMTGFKDEDEQPLWVIEKERRDSPFKIDLAMCGVLSWQARLDAIATGEFKRKKPSAMIVLK
jgi:phage terminase large subunit-like protein